MDSNPNHPTTDTNITHTHPTTANTHPPTTTMDSNPNHPTTATAANTHPPTTTMDSNPNHPTTATNITHIHPTTDSNINAENPPPNRLFFYKCLPDDYEIIHVLDFGGCDVIQHSQIVKRDVYSDHIWKLLDGLRPVIHNQLAFILQSPRYRCEDKPSDFRRMIVSGEAYWKQIGTKSWISDGLCLGYKASYKYVLGNINLPMAGAHETAWRMTEYVSEKGDGLTSICVVKFVDKNVVAAFNSMIKSQEAVRKARNQLVTGLRLLEARRRKADKAGAERAKLVEAFDDVVGDLQEANTAFESAVRSVTKGYNDKVTDVEVDLWVGEQPQEPEPQPQPQPQPQPLAENALEPQPQEPQPHEPQEPLQPQAENALEPQPQEPQPHEPQEPLQPQAEKALALEGLSMLLAMPEAQIFAPSENMYGDDFVARNNLESTVPEQILHHAAAPPGQKLPIRRKVEEGDRADRAVKEEALGKKVTERLNTIEIEDEGGTIESPTKSSIEAKTQAAAEQVLSAAQQKFMEELDPCVKEAATLYYPSKDIPDAAEVNHTDLRCLAPEEHLTSTIMNFYIRYLQHATVSSNSKNYIFFNTYVYSKLEELKYEEGEFDKFRKWWRKINLFDKAYIILPVHGGEHWSLVIICLSTKENVEGVPLLLHLDSLGLHDSKLVFRNIKRFLKEEWNFIRKASASNQTWENFENRIEQKILKVPKQDNLHDCGLFVLNYMKRFITEAPERMLEKDLSMFNENWFPPQEASNLRTVIRDILVEEFRKVNPAKPSSCLQ